MKKNRRYITIRFFSLFTVLLILIALTLGCLQIEIRQEGNLVYSSDLKTISKTYDNKESISYVNSEGEITYASDKHYATVIKTRDDTGNTITEAYFDENGKPEKQQDGHYALKRTYDEKGQNIETTYLDDNLNPCKNQYGYATIRRTFNEKGKKEKETFYDDKGNRVKHLIDEYSRYFEYDDETGKTSITYLGIDDKPTRKMNRYAKVIRSYWENGKIKTDLYYDEHSQPIKLSLGQYGIYREYDESGRDVSITYLDASEQPIKTVLGYATVKYSYQDGITTEMYYDENGEPVQLSRGQYGIKQTGNEAVYLNEKGEEQFELSIYLRHHPWLLIVIAFATIALCTFLDKKGNVYLWIASVLFLIYITLLYRGTEGTGATLEPLWSYKQFFTKDTLRLEILNNIWLFIPLGCILYNILHHPKVLIILILMSVIIEICQYFFGAGLCELDDVISNGIGGAIGYGTGCAIKSIRDKQRKPKATT